MLARNGSTRSLGSLRQSDGTLTNDPHDTLSLLTRTHFPGSSQLNDEEADDDIRIGMTCGYDTVDEIFSTEVVRWSLLSFGTFKSAGVDEIFPGLIQKGIEILLEPIRSLYIASYRFAYVPKVWREAQVVYIPKSGNRSPDDPRSWRAVYSFERNGEAC